MPSMKLDLPMLARFLPLVLVVAGCDDAAAPKADAPKPVAASTAPAASPTPERLTERVRAMWERKVAADWVEVYDFLSPQARKLTPISRYLQGKEYHTYANPRVHEVLHLDKDKAHVRVSMLWTPTHPQIQQVHLDPGQTLDVTQDVETIETWRWTDGEWYFVEAASVDDFFEEHPEFLKKDEAKPAKTAAGAEPASAGAPEGAGAENPKR
jgi:hypothetical protein